MNEWINEGVDEGMSGLVEERVIGKEEMSGRGDEVRSG